MSPGSSLSSRKPGRSSLTWPAAILVGAEHAGSDASGPETFLAESGLRDVCRANDLTADLPLFLALVPRAVGVEIDAQRGGEHAGGQVLGVVAGLLLILAVVVDLGEVAVLLGVAGDGDADGAGTHAEGLVGGHARNHGEDDLARLQHLDALVLGHDLAVGREDAGNGDEVDVGDAGIAERQLETGQLLAVAAHTLGEEHCPWYEFHRFSWGVAPALLEMVRPHQTPQHI